MQRAVRAGLGIVTGLMTVVLLAELVCRVLPVSTATVTGYHLDPLILTYPSGHRFRTATGWDLRNAQTLQANNLGFVSDVDFVPDPQAVALIGDSYVEASMLPSIDRLGPKLQGHLGDRPVYAMGGPGSSLLDYAERIRLGSERLGVRDFVVFLESGDIRQSLCGSGNIHGPCLDRQTLAPRITLQTPPSTLRRWVRESAFAQYLFSQLRVAPDRLVPELLALPQAALPRLDRQSAATTPPSSAPSPVRSSGPSAQALDAVAVSFFERVRPWVTGRLVVVLDRQRNGEPPSELDAEVERFARLAQERGATVVDMAPLYREHATRSTLSLSVGPYDGHLNALGLGLVARAAGDALRNATPWPGADSAR